MRNAIKMVFLRILVRGRVLVEVNDELLFGI